MQVEKSGHIAIKAGVESSQIRVMTMNMEKYGQFKVYYEDIACWQVRYGQDKEKRRLKDDTQVSGLGNWLEGDVLYRI